MLKIIHILSCWKVVVCIEYALFDEYAIFCEIADNMMFWLPWLHELK